MRRIFHFIIIITLVFNTNKIYSVESIFGFDQHQIYRQWVDTIFVIKDLKDINQINDFIDSFSLNHTDLNTKSIAITFDKLSENQIDSSIMLIKYWNNIVHINFLECPITKLPKSIDSIYSLSNIKFEKCDFIVSMNNFNSDNFIFSISFVDCRIKRLPAGLEKLTPMLSLILIFPDDFYGFDINNELLKFEKRKNIIDLYINYYLIDKFPESIFNLQFLQNFIFMSDKIINYPAKFEKLNNLRQISITSFDDRVEESAHKISTLNYYYRLRKAGIKSRWEETYFLNDFRSQSKNFIDYKFRLFYSKELYSLNKKVLDTLSFCSHNIIIESKINEGKINLYFSDIITDDQIKVAISDSTDKFLFSTEEKNKTAVIDLNGYNKGFYYVKVNINYMSIKFQVIDADDRRK